jgi:hypothetical protein
MALKIHKAKYQREGGFPSALCNIFGVRLSNVWHSADTWKLVTCKLCLKKRK